VPRRRLKALAQRGATQRDESEAAVAGYYRLLNRTHAGNLDPPFSSDAVLALHAELHAPVTGEGGRWKTWDNLICRPLPDGGSTTRFTLPADETPQAMDELCGHLREAWESGDIDPLLLTSAFVLDFLCIFPFATGNQRLARLLSTMLLVRAGYHVARYISLERLVERTRDAYYDALWASSDGWRIGHHGVSAWHEYNLGLLLYACRELERLIGEAPAATGTRRDAVPAAVAMLPPGYTFSAPELHCLCASVSQSTVRRTLDVLCEEGEVKRLDTGRAGRWKLANWRLTRWPR
jgi:Fic family protein